MSQIFSRALSCISSKCPFSWKLTIPTNIHHVTSRNTLAYENWTIPVANYITSKFYSTKHAERNILWQPHIQQIRQMSWGNVHTPMKRYKHRPNKHRDPKGRRWRAHKIIKVDLPDKDFERKLASGQVSPEEMRAELKLKGVLPPSRYSEVPFTIASTGSYFEEYKPTEGSTKIDWMDKSEDTEESGWSLKKAVGKAKEKGLAKTFRATRKIRTFDDNFDGASFPTQEGTEVYINAHKALAAKDEKRLHQLATEKVFPEMITNTKGKSIYWEFVKSLEPPHVVQVRCEDVLSQSNVFAQVTVRFHTQQILAVYDRFGRLIHGNPHVAKDVLEYVVFEKHLADTYGKWRLHGKIIPQTAANERLGGYVTHVVKDLSDEEIDEKVEETNQEEEISEEQKKYAISYKSDKDNKSETIYDRFGRMIGIK